MAKDICFRGIDAPLRIDDAGPVVDLLPTVVTGWPYEIHEANPFTDPFFTIRPEPGADRVRCITHIEDKPARTLDPLNALCDMVAALPHALARTNDSLICLHAAAVGIGDRLVVFPNIRRAGKSTLTAALAMAGQEVFSDDVLPTSFDETGNAYGHAMGIAPRLRLPLPMTIPARFREWVDGMPGPDNRQYKYLNLRDQPPNGRVLQVGSFVILDRQDEPHAAQLRPVTADVAMDALLHQNFTRDRHSSDILQSIATVLSNEPAFRLTYSDLVEAVDCLLSFFDFQPRAPARPSSVPIKRFRMADLTSRVPAIFTSGSTVRQRDGSLEQAIGENLYLADPEGQAIHRVDALTLAIWELLEEPIAVSELQRVLAEAFVNVPADRIAADLETLLTQLAKAGLIDSVRSS